MTVVFLTNASTSPWSKPGDWVSADDGRHTAELLGNGASSLANTTGANSGAKSGGSGGAYMKLATPSGSIGSSIPFACSAGTAPYSVDQNTWATYWENTTNSNSYQAQN